MPQAGPPVLLAVAGSVLRFVPVLAVDRVHAGTRTRTFRAKHEILSTGRSTVLCRRAADTR
eukprot:scaffold321930_cov33-Prasinocladus_malaysianus.AAC.1